MLVAEQPVRPWHPGRRLAVAPSRAGTDTGTYSSLPLPGAWRFTADYQFIVNPTYNRDRGPVSIIGARLRTMF
jgi:hypothetical protein